MSSCIYYHPEGYSTKSERLMGRHAAGESFIRGYFEYASFDQGLWAECSHQDHFKDFCDRARQMGREEEIRWIHSGNLEALQQPGVLYIPGPVLGEQAVRRRHHGDLSWSLCGVTHTTSSAQSMDAIGNLLLAPIQPWDALICPSTAVKKNAEVILQAKAEYLKERLGASKFVLPKMPVIPLGIHCDDFSFSEDERARFRSQLNADSNSVIVLYVGRLSFHAKAHPLSMYQALESVAADTDKEIILIECGWHANEHIAKAFSDAADTACPSVKVITLDGRNEENRRLAWGCADIFCSLSDNIQETFGIVPIEAMASGLPVVVSDWDGYRDSVREGTDGFRVPTVAPAAHLAGDLAVRHSLGVDTYDMYCGHSSSLVGMHAQKLHEAFSALVESPELRKTMGDNGRKRARSEFDWQHIIHRYEELWKELGEIRSRASRDKQRPINYLWAERLDPTISFGHYPSSVLGPETLLTFTKDSLESALSEFSQLTALKMVNYAEYVFPTREEITMIFERALELKSAGEPTVASGRLVEGINADRRPYCVRSLAWLIKLGFFLFE